MTSADSTGRRRQNDGWTAMPSAGNCVSARDNGTLAFTKIGNRTYYRQEDVERVIVDVEERRKEAKWKGKGI